MVLKSELLLFEYKEFWKKPLKIAFLADFSITLIKGLYLFLLFFGKNCHSKVEQFYFLISCRDSPKIHLNCHIKLTQLLIPWFFGLYPHCLCEERKGGKSHYWSLLRSEDDWYSLEVIIVLNVQMFVCLPSGFVHMKWEKLALGCPFSHEILRLQAMWTKPRG